MAYESALPDDLRGPADAVWEEVRPKLEAIVGEEQVLQMRMAFDLGFAAGVVHAEIKQQKRRGS